MEELKKFKSSTVNIPDGLVKINDGKVDYEAKFADSPHLVIYHGPEECSTCLLSHGYIDYSYLREIQNSGRCDVLVILAPSDNESARVFDYLCTMDSDFPLYYDPYDYFSACNPDLPVDSRFHSFLLNEENTRCLLAILWRTMR